MIVPTVIQRTSRGERATDIYSALLEQRIVFLGTQVDDDSANLIVAQMLHLESVDPGKDIALYINSPGGSITSLFAIYDTMRYVSCDIVTLCIGQAASAAAVLLSGGTPGKRFILPHGRVLLHQPSGGARGQASDIEVAAREIVRMRTTLNDILATNCNKDVADIERDLDRDYILTADEAVAYGIVDEVVASRQSALEVAAA